MGREVDSIVRDLTDVAVKLAREEETAKVRTRAEDAAEDRILDALPPGPRNSGTEVTEQASASDTRQKFRKMLREGKLDDREIDIEIKATPTGVEIMAPPGMEEMSQQLQGMFQNLSGGKTSMRKMRIKDAFKQLIEEEASRMVNEEDIKLRAIHAVEENGIVFIDELDKVARRAESQGADVSREGVQRDLLPLVEGCTVSTKYGMVRSDHILFIASGAFHLARPSDLIPELQGRLPIRVELSALSPDDFERILTEPSASLTEQYQALMATEGVDVEFSDDGLRRIAETAWHVNERTENIGVCSTHDQTHSKTHVLGQ